MTQKQLRGIFLVVLVLFFATNTAVAQEDFYKGKTIRVIVAASAGGGFDTYARTMARHMSKHIPGSPSIIVENMPGAGHLIGANHVYRVAKPDGLTIGHFQGGLFLHQLLGRPGIEFEASKFEFIGAPVVDNRACAFTRASGITSVERWLASKTPVKLGGIPGAAPDDIARMLTATTPLPIQLVGGYKGTADIRLAAESGEIAGGCWTWDSIRATWTKAIQSGDAVVVLQILAKPHPELPKVPLAIDLAKTDEARELIRVGIQEPSSYYRPFVLPPGTPKDRKDSVRKAFLATLKDPAFLAEAKKARLDVEPVTGEQMEKMISDLAKLEAPMVSRLKEILTIK